MLVSGYTEPSPPVPSGSVSVVQVPRVVPLASLTVYVPLMGVYVLGVLFGVDCGDDAVFVAFDGGECGRADDGEGFLSGRVAVACDDDGGVVG